MNQITFNGHLANDPKTRLVNNQEVVNFTVASTGTIKDSNDEFITMWYSCHVWGKYGKYINNMHKGDPIIIYGSLNVKPYELPDGSKTCLMDVRVTNYVPLVSVKHNETQSSSVQPQPTKYQKDDDLPF